MTVHQIRHPRDAVDTATQFHLELDNAFSVVPQRRSWLLSASRERRARFMDAFAVTLLMLIMAVFGCIVLLASTPQAKADATSFAYAAHNATAVCEVIAEFPSAAGVLGIMAAIAEHGLTREQAAEAVVTSVAAVCPWRMPTLEAFAARGINA